MGGKMRVAILQSCYIPWKGYFDIIGQVDRFIIYDDVQYRQRHWHNRNIIKTANGPLWLTIPVSLPSGQLSTIETVEIAGPFAEKHWKSIAASYVKAPHFAAISPAIEAMFKALADFERLSDVNYALMAGLCDLLHVKADFAWSRDIPAHGSKTERLLSICKHVGATSYLSGPAAKNYLDEKMFADAGIQVEWMDYSGYPEYPQLHGAFDHQVSIVDLIFNAGEQAKEFMKTRAS